MKSSKLKKLCAVLMTATIGLSLFTGCGAEKADDPKHLIFNLGEDPETIDPTLNTSSGAGTIIINAFEGLMSLDENEKPILGAASDMQVSDDNLVYTFTINENAKWSDGVDLTANDFAYSWKRALDKKTAAEYSYQLFYIKNAEKYYNGQATEEELGIKVIDEKTLEVTLESPTSYFTQLLSFPTYMPLREDIVSANSDTWATKVETYVSNGPFKLTKWDMKDQLVFEKNENYWDASNVKLDKLTYKLVTDLGSSYASLKAGDFDMIDSVPPAEIENAKKDGLADIKVELGTYFFAVNVGKQDGISNEDAKKALSNKLVRQALALAIDRQAIIDNVGKADQIPAYSFVPQGIFNEDGSEFSSKEYFNPTEGAVEANREKAKELLKEAGYPNGEGLPTFELIYNTEGSHKDVCQLVQQDWAEIGVTVELQNEEWAVFLNTRQNGDYQIARHAWIGDYVDPMTFLDMWVTGGGNNDCGFSNAEYDKLIADAKVETDTVKRQEMLRKAEDILMDEMPIIPIYYYTKVRGVKPSVKGIQCTALGKVYFKNAYKEAN